MKLMKHKKLVLALAAMLASVGIRAEVTELVETPFLTMAKRTTATAVLHRHICAAINLSVCWKLLRASFPTEEKR